MTAFGDAVVAEDDEATRAAGGHRGQNRLDSFGADFGPASLPAERAEDGVRAVDGLSDRRGVAHIAGHDTQPLVRRDSRRIPGERGDLVSVLQGLLDDVATGTAGRAEDGKTHGVSCLWFG